MYQHELQAKVDYLYCETCGLHVPCIRLDAGAWEVQCPRCTGQCGLCSCHRGGRCLGQGKAPVPTHMYVVEREGKSE